MPNQQLQTKMMSLLGFFNLTLGMPSWVMALVPPLLGLLLIIIWRRRMAADAVDRLSSLAWQASGIATYASSLPQLKLDFASARRYQRPLSVAVFSLEPNQNPPSFIEAVRRNGHRAVGSLLSVSDAIQLVFPLIGSILQAALRKSDKVTYDGANNQYVVIFTQTDKAGSANGVRRVQNILINKSYVNLKIGLAQFPIDGLTLEDLVNFARLSSEIRPLDADIVSPAVNPELPTPVST